MRSDDAETVVLVPNTSRRLPLNLALVLGWATGCRPVPTTSQPVYTRACVRSARPRRSVLGLERRTVGETVNSMSGTKVGRGLTNSPLVIRTDEERDLHTERGQWTCAPGHPLAERGCGLKRLLQIIIPCVLWLRAEKHGSRAKMLMLAQEMSPASKNEIYSQSQLTSYRLPLAWWRSRTTGTRNSSRC